MRRDLVRKDIVAAGEAERAKRQAIAREAIDKARRRAVLDHHYLTGNEVWDRYLRQVNELQDVDAEELKALEAKDRVTGYEPSEKTAERRFQMAILRERLAARDQCMKLPATLAAVPKGDE